MAGLRANLDAAAVAKGAKAVVAIRAHLLPRKETFFR